VMQHGPLLCVKSDTTDNDKSDRFKGLYWTIDNTYGQSRNNPLPKTKSRRMIDFHRKDLKKKKNKL
jgi:hypothetical protein